MKRIPKSKDMSEKAGTGYGEIFERKPYDIGELRAAAPGLFD